MATQVLRRRTIINVRNVVAVARMERRHTHRVLRYWVFLTVAYLGGLGAYFYYSTLHAFFSSVSPSVGIIGPRFMVGAIGLYYLTGFVLCIVFLGFDVRDRDVREGIAEVLDSRPLTNFELVSGRFVALFLSAWLPIVLLALLIQGLGWLLPRVGSSVGATVEPYSLIYLVVPMAIPAIAITIAFVFAITLIVRHRLIAALISVAAIVAAYGAVFVLPSTHAPWVDFLGSTQQAFPSDIVPALMEPRGSIQRMGVLAIALGLLTLAAAIHPRLDGGRRARLAAAAAALVLIGVVGLALSAQRLLADAAQIDHWRGAHEARAGEPVADILSIAGSIDIVPGERLDADLSIDLTAPADQALERVLLTLNPGFIVSGVETNNRALAFQHVDGLLDVSLARPLPAGEQTSLTLRYGGRPDVLFGYLDSTLDLERLQINQAMSWPPDPADSVRILGDERGIFDRRYVALTPGIRWLPVAGVDAERDDATRRGKDYFEVDLEVQLPASWLAAGPARRQALGNIDDRARFRFAPAASLPEVALMASEFLSVGTDIKGIAFEVLLHPNHDGNLTVLADAREEIEQWAAERLEVAAAAGLAYPFDALTIVEVPNRLRSYQGGWRLDTALAPPAMVLMRESSFPTARFDFDAAAAFGGLDVDQQEGGAARVYRARLVNFFANDFSGGNLFAGAARSFFSHRTSAVGEGAIALDFVLEELSTLLVSGRRNYFSAHAFLDVNEAATAAAGSRAGADTVADSLIGARTARTAVWDAALDASLAQIDPWEDPQRTIDLLTLKGGGMAQALYDTLGANAVGALLADLLERHVGGNFTLADFIAAGERVDADLRGLLEDWVGTTGLPGFIADSAELYRLPDDPSGTPRYQVLLRLRNAEPVVGFARVGWDIEPGGPRTLSEPIRIAGLSTVEFGVVLSAPPIAVFVHPYVSLNRGDFLASRFDIGEMRRRDTEPLDGVRDAPFVGVRDARIVADDLDTGFAIVTAEGNSGIRLTRAEGGGGSGQTDFDQGLPIAGGDQPPRRWSRRAAESAWGHYRHTFAYIGAGDGTRRAVMPAQIPAAGVWRLQIYVPPATFLPLEALGTWHLEIVSESGRDAVSYEASIAHTGWNIVGEYRLPAGEVRVEVTDRTDGRTVIADAVAWSPVP